MRAKLIAGVIAAFLLLPVGANADEHETDCYLTPTAEVCTPEEEPEVLSEVLEREDDVTPADEVLTVEVLGVSETALPDTGIDTWMLLSLALGLLALGGAALAGFSRTTTK